MDFTVIERAGMTQLEFGELLHVSRVTINTWVGGKMKPHRFVAPRVTKILFMLEAAITAGRLPLPKEITPMNRAGAIVGAIRDAAGVSPVAVAD